MSASLAMAFHSSLLAFGFLFYPQCTVQLQCAPVNVEAAVGSNFRLHCQYDTRRTRFSKKYWCLGEFRSSCSILMDTDGFTKRELKGRFVILDGYKRGLSVVMKDLKFSDTGYYWVGIDKMNADIMLRVSITVIEVPVSEPRLQFLSPVTGTCWGEPLTVRCTSDQGTNLRYSWYKTENHESISLGVMKDLWLHCDVVGDGDLYYCRVSNSVNSKHSPSVSVQLLQSAKESCVYILSVEGEEQYDCWERLRTSTAPYQDTTGGPNFVYQSTSVTYNKEINVSVRVRTGMPVWYEVLRWLLFASLLTALCLVRKCCRAHI
ncbi:hypothetical protein GJAV_G00185330 [Gymnothorax javanicus]|nr:hypothetical protein GJAV_G00185330 [Gymnothorax javanicus]